MAAELTLLGRTYCHLCDDMRDALGPIAEEFGVGVEWVDVDSAPELEYRFGELVPVLLYQGEELCHYFLDEAKVRECLAGIR